MRLAVWVMVVLVLFLLAGVLPGRDAAASPALFSSPVFIVLLVVLCVEIVWCCARRMTKRRAVFMLSHASILVILAGVLSGYMWGEKAVVPLPTDASSGVREIPREGRAALPLGFTVVCEDFRVEYYEPFYNIYRPNGAADTNGLSVAHAPFVFVRKVAVLGKSAVALDDGISVPVADLQVGGEWKPLHRAGNGWAFQLARTAKHYEAALRFTSSDGTSEQQILAVNKPAEYLRWRLYLTDYDQEHGKYIWVILRRDPGRGAVILGIWGLMVGIAALCWFERGLHEPIDFDAEEEP